MKNENKREGEGTQKIVRGNIDEVKDNLDLPKPESEEPKTSGSSMEDLQTKLEKEMSDYELGKDVFNELSHDLLFTCYKGLNKRPLPNDGPLYLLIELQPVDIAAEFTDNKSGMNTRINIMPAIQVGLHKTAEQTLNDILLEEMVGHNAFSLKEADESSLTFLKEFYGFKDINATKYVPVTRTVNCEEFDLAVFRKTDMYATHSNEYLFESFKIGNFLKIIALSMDPKYRTIMAKIINQSKTVNLPNYGTNRHTVFNTNNNQTETRISMTKESLGKIIKCIDEQVLLDLDLVGRIYAENGYTNPRELIKEFNRVKTAYMHIFESAK